MGRATASWVEGFDFWGLPGWNQRYSRLQIPRLEPEVTQAFASETNRHVFVRTSWDENMAVIGGGVAAAGATGKLVKSDWVLDYQRAEGLPQPSGYNCREAFLQALLTADPDTLLFGFDDLELSVGHEQELRQFARVFTHLPKEKFAPVLETGLQTSLAIRQLTRGALTYLYVANPGFWPVTGTLTLSGNLVVNDLVTGQPLPVKRAGGKTDLPVALPPHGVFACTVGTPTLKVDAYNTLPPPDRERSYLRGIIKRVEALLADPEARLALAPSDRDFATRTLADGGQALQQGQYARAWSLLSHWRFRSLWQYYLEPDGQGGG